jgi:hypothetical protein
MGKDLLNDARISFADFADSINLEAENLGNPHSTVFEKTSICETCETFVHAPLGIFT